MWDRLEWEGHALIMTSSSRRFWNDDVGAVTVDWVVMTAAIVGLSIAMIGMIRAGLGGSSTAIQSELTDYSIDDASAFSTEERAGTAP